MADSQVPGTPGDTGVQRALGERRRRRVAERTGQVDLDATMSHWPVTEPPTTPRPVVRPARPSAEGYATSPVLPTPGAMVVGPLLEARSAAAPRSRGTGSRRSRRGDAAAGSTGATGTVGTPAQTSASPGTDAAASDHPAPTARDEPTSTGPTADDLANGSAANGSVSIDPVSIDPVFIDPVPTDASTGPTSAGPTSTGPTSTGPVPTAAASTAPAASASTVTPTASPAATASAASAVRRRGAAADPVPVPTPLPRPPTTRVGARAPRALLAEAQRVGRGGGLRERLSGRTALLVLAAILVVVLVVVGVLVSMRPGEDPADAVAPVPDVPAQQTLALTLADGTAGRGLVGAALVGVDSAEVSTLLVPPDLLLTVADAGPVSVTEASLLGAEPVRRGLEDTLLLRVDGVVLLQPAQLATLVDAVGGVVLDVTSEVATENVLVAVGEDQRLAGAQAAAYATLSVDGEPGEARLARLGAVVQGLLAALPSDPADVGPTLLAAGVTATQGLPPDELAQLVASAAARAAAGNAEQVVLPTRELAAADTARRGVDDAAARPELDARFAGALLPVAAVGEVRVQVSNGVGRPGLGAAARDLLVADGLRYAGGGNVEEFGVQPETVVLVASQAEEDRDRGEAVAAALGLGEDALQVNRETLVDTDVVVVLGDDFARAVAEQATGTAPPGTTPSGEAP